MRKRFAVALAGLSLFAGLLATQSYSTGQPQAAQWVSTYRWQIPVRWFGGFSGLEISIDGTKITAISDRGQFVQANLQRDGDQIVGVDHVVANKVLNASGKRATRAGMRDSEGLVETKDGSFVVSFEGAHRVARFAHPGGVAQAMPWHEAFDVMKLNGGFEALAINSSGHLYAMAETPIDAETRVQVFVLKNTTWRPASSFARDENYQPVGADFGPDGRLYVLERGFNGFGFRTRARSFAVTEGRFHDEKLLFHKGVGGHDNLEGLAVWRDAAGRIRLTMISDDNFRFLQRTEIVEYVVAD